MQPRQTTWIRSTKRGSGNLIVCSNWTFTESQSDWCRRRRWELHELFKVRRPGFVLPFFEQGDVPVQIEVVHHQAFLHELEVGETVETNFDSFTTVVLSVVDEYQF